MVFSDEDKTLVKICISKKPWTANIDERICRQKLEVVVVTTALATLLTESRLAQRVHT